jgi:dipeptidyl aminopeptidase/acylaminoacyl peptidase
MKRLRNKKGLLEALVVIGLILLIPLFFTMRTTAEQNAAPPLPTVANAPADSNALAPKQPPACTFPLAQTTTAETPPENYTFSEPQVVLTAGSDDATISVIEWLPDNQRVLITQEFRSNAEQNIELFNPQTGEKQVYATRHANDKRPKWLPELDAVIYPAMNILKEDKVNHRFTATRQALTSQGDPKNPHLIEDNLSDSTIGVNPDNGQIVFLSDKHISKKKASLESLPSIAFDPIRWHYRPMGMGLPPSFDMAWRPGSSQIFLYSDGNTNGGYTFLLDSNTGDVCELNFEGWAGVGRWSSDGRYLAITRSTDHYPIMSSDLAVLDTATGNVHTMQLTPQDMIGRHYVGDFAWAPDNIHLLAIGYILPFPPTGRLYDEDKFSGLYLVDFILGQGVHVVPEHKFFAGWPGANIAWSPDGAKLLIGCPANDVLRLCFLSVQKTK